jgi:hypothetical protein
VTLDILQNASQAATAANALTRYAQLWDDLGGHEKRQHLLDSLVKKQKSTGEKKSDIPKP